MKKGNKYSEKEINTIAQGYLDYFTRVNPDGSIDTAETRRAFKDAFEDYEIRDIREHDKTIDEFFSYMEEKATEEGCDIFRSTLGKEFLKKVHFLFAILK